MLRWGTILVPLSILLVGAVLWWPPTSAPNRYSDLGTALIGGGIVSFTVLYMQQQFSRSYEKRDLQLQLGAGTSFPGIDLGGRDLSRFYLAGKDFSGALRNANLRGTNLSGVNLSHANLNGADLRGAKLDETPLYPSKTLYPSKDRRPGPIYSAATIQNTGLDKVKYDSLTRWPNHIDPDEVGAIRS